MLSRVEHGKSFITSGPDALDYQCRGCWYGLASLIFWMKLHTEVPSVFSSAGASYSLDHSRPRAYCTCSRWGWGLFGLFSLVYHFSVLSPSLWETARYRLKYCLKGPLSPKQPTRLCWWDARPEFSLAHTRQ